MTFDDTPATEPSTAPAELGRSPRRRFRRVITLTLAAILIAAVSIAVVTWPEPSPSSDNVSALRVDPRPRPDGPLRITGVDTALVWVSSEQTSVSIRVTNTSKAGVVARVWWLLAAPGDPMPWKHPTAQPAPRSLALAAGQSRWTRVPSSLGLIKSGSYDLSLWVHTYDASTHQWVHSDGRSMLSPVHVAPPGGGFTHIGGTSTALWVQNVTVPTTWHAKAPATVQVDIANATRSLYSIQVWWFLSPTASQTPWKITGSIQSQTVSATADPGDVTSLNVPMQSLPREGTYRLTVWLHQRDRSGSAPRDGVLLDTPVRVTR